MYTEEELREFADDLAEQWRRLERSIVERICGRVKKIGELTKEDVRELERLREIGGDLQTIEQEFAKTLEMSQASVENLLRDVAGNTYAGTAERMRGIGYAATAFTENQKVQSLITSIAAVTQGKMKNISGTTAFANKNGTFAPLRQVYQQTVDDAVIQIREGVTDYNTAMRKAVKQLSDNGMTRVEYDNGNRPYRRRVDSSVRNDISGAMQQLRKEEAEALGKEIGADGREIDYHANPRPSHAAMGGQQYDMATFNRDIVPLLNDYNCHHYAFPIIPGVSPPAYSKEELAALKERDLEKHTFEGRQYTGYEATQMQRRLETEIRRSKELSNAYKASGDKHEANVYGARARILTEKYTQFSKAMELPTQPERAAIAGYKSSLTTDKAKSILSTAKSTKSTVSAAGKTFMENGLTNGGSSDRIIIAHLGTVEGKTLAETLHNVEEARRGLNYEVGTVISKNGEILAEYVGEAHAVGMPDDGKLKDNIFSHNHPNGRTFTVADIDTFVQSKAAEMRASTPQGTFFSLSESGDEVNRSIANVMKAEGVGSAESAAEKLKQTLGESADDDIDGYFTYLYNAMAEDVDTWLIENAVEFGYKYEKGAI